MAAARIVPEWVQYDSELKQLLRQFQEEDDPEAHVPAPSEQREGSLTHLGPHLLRFFVLAVEVMFWMHCVCELTCCRNYIVRLLI